MDKKAKTLIITTAAASAIAGSFILTKKVKKVLKEDRCKECGRKINSDLFTVYEPEDMAYLSSDVLEPRFNVSGKVCPDCYENIYKEAIKEYEDALELSVGVKLYFKDFKGTIDYSEEIRKISTECYENKEDAIQSLKTMANYLGCNVVFDVEFKSEIINSDGFKKVMYKAKGILAKS